MEYEELVESIRNLVMGSPCVDDLEDRGVPLDMHVHRFLEQVRNHQCKVIRSLSVPIQKCDPGTDVDHPRVSMGAGHQGHGGNKRKNGERSGPGRGGRETNENHPDGDGCDGVDSDPGNVKKQKTGDVGKLSCPFRKRNPTRFNVRSYDRCALGSFQTLALLK